MKITEAREYMKLEDEGKLPVPQSVPTDETDRQELYVLHQLFAFSFDVTKQDLKKVRADIKKTQEEGRTDEGLKIRSRRGFNLIVKSAIQVSPSVEEFSGKGSIEQPYLIKTKYGTGKFFDARFMFKRHKWPAFLKRNNCYYNSRLAAMNFISQGFETKQITGIIYSDKPYLHSVAVLEFDGRNGHKRYILDANYHVVMDYDLYMKLFNFEVLASVDGKDLLKHKADIDKYEDICKAKGEKLTYTEMALAHEDIVNTVKNLNADGVGV